MMKPPLSDSRNVSARGCEVEYIDTNIGTLDICEYYRQIIPARISNFQCSSCSAELCNHAGYEIEEEQVEEDDEDEAPVDEVEEEGNSANVFTVSLSLLAGIVGVGLAVL